MTNQLQYNLIHIELEHYHYILSLYSIYLLYYLQAKRQLYPATTSTFSF